MAPCGPRPKPWSPADGLATWSEPAAPELGRQRCAWRLPPQINPP
jgi:hypothetical protein